MKHLRQLPDVPAVTLTVLAVLAPTETGFLRRVSRRIELYLAGSSRGQSVYDEVDRAALDAVVVVPYFLIAADATGQDSDPQDEVWVVLRSALRPPVALKPAERSPCPESGKYGLWEVPAGLVESDECSLVGLRRAALRELWEETGFQPPDSALRELGPPTYPCPGVVAERQFFFCAPVDPAARLTPPLDGSALESVGELVAVPLAVALAAAAAGQLADAKSELALRRLKEMLAP